LDSELALGWALAPQQGGTMVEAEYLRQRLLEEQTQVAPKRHQSDPNGHR
jgi:hypothetical protein